MLLALTLLTGCSNIFADEWSGGGARYASGEAWSLQDTAGDTAGGGDTGSAGDPGGPELGSASASYTTVTETGQIYIEAGILYSDDPDDTVGGNLYFDVYGDGELIEQTDRNIVGADPDANSDAWAKDGILSFTYGPVEDGVVHTLESVFVVDLTNNHSNEIEVDVTGE
jgi:hypothetical protein